MTVSLFTSIIKRFHANNATRVDYLHRRINRTYPINRKTKETNH